MPNDPSFYFPRGEQDFITHIGIEREPKIAAQSYIIERKKKGEKRLYFVADAVKWHNATVWSNYRAYVDGLSIEMEDKSFQRKWWRLMVSRGNHTVQFLFDSTPLCINCCKIAQSCEAPFAM